MQRPHWTTYKNGCYSESVFRIGHLVGEVDEWEPGGVHYTEKDFDPSKPKVFAARLGSRLLLPTPTSSYFATEEEAADRVEQAARDTARAVLAELGDS